MKTLRNICLVIMFISIFGIYLGFKNEMFEVVTITAVSTILCAFMAIYCHEESNDDAEH